jgi:uncharacterized protein (DUF2225 family)
MHFPELRGKIKNKEFTCPNCGAALVNNGIFFNSCRILTLKITYVSFGRFTTNVFLEISACATLNLIS